MTRHLHRDVLVVLAEGGCVGPRDAEHARSCARCGDEVASLAAVLADLRRDEMPEPSPLFWEHLSARIGAAVANEARETGRQHAPGIAGWRWWVTAASLSAAVFALLLTIGTAPVSRTDTWADAGGVAGAALDADTTPADAWQVVVDVASSVDVSTAGDELAELAPAAGDGAVLDLTPEERAALVQLLHQEMAGAAL